MYTSALSASLCASGERPDDAPAPTPGISVARWTHAVRMDASTRALEPPAHAAAATYRLLALEIEYAKILQIRVVYLSLPQSNSDLQKFNTHKFWPRSEHHGMRACAGP